MSTTSKNYVVSKRNHIKGLLIGFLITLLLTFVIVFLVLWSIYSCIKAGVIEKFDFMGVILWSSYIFNVPLCALDSKLFAFIGSNYYFFLADIALVGLLFLFLFTGKNDWKGVEHGSAHWATKKELLPFKKADNNMPLADGIYLTPEAHPANRNVFVLAAPGGGKSFRVIIPAIEALTRDVGDQGSFFCTDTKGALYRDTVKMVRDRGVKTYLVNLSDPWFSHRYNPLDNVHPERKVNEITKLALAYAKNVRDTEAGVGDAIWEDTFKQLLSAIWLYQYDYSVNPLTMKNESRAMWRTAELVQSISGGQGIDRNGEFARIIEAIRKTSPLHPAVRNFDFIATGAGETVQSVIITAGSKIYPFTYPEIESMTRANDIVIDRLFDEPSGVYLNYDIGSPYQAIAALFIEQLFSSAYYIAETKYSGKLPRPFKFFLDELPNICRVYSLPERASTSRSYNIDLVISVQSMQQLQHIFKDAEKTLMNNCVTHIYLGSGEADALKTISEALGKTTAEEKTRSRNTGMTQGGGSDSERSLGREIALPSEIYSMPDLYAIVKMQHHQPIFAKKYQTEKQIWYSLLGGVGNPENNRDIHTDLEDVSLIYKAEYYAEYEKRQQDKIKTNMEQKENENN